MQGPVERVRGFHDLPPDEYPRWSAARTALVEVLERHDFTLVDLPVVEQLDLYMRKTGAQVLSKLYSFTDQGNREVALRPEFTASVIRAFAAQAQPGRAPLRLAYAGPVFRYEKPQRATMRQFTQVGVEVLGDGDRAADAALLAVACEAARAAGAGPLRLVIGHLGPLRTLLSHLRVHGYAEDYLLEHLEFYNRGPAQRQAVRARLGLDVPQGEVEDDGRALPRGLAAAVHDLEPEEARTVVSTILGQMSIELTGSTRTPEEIIDRVLAKARRQGDTLPGSRGESLARALAFLEQFGTLRGTPESVAPRAGPLLAEYGVPASALDDLWVILERLDGYDMSNVSVELAPGMARGIAYYSGLIFELYAGGDEAPLQICGGGRYDGLARAITRKVDIPALGFAFGLERLLHAVPEEAPTVAGRPRVAVLSGDPGRRGEAQRAAAAIRAVGIACVVLEVGDARALDQARRAGFWGAVVLDPPAEASGVERAGRTQIWKGGDPLREQVQAALRDAGRPGAATRAG